MTVKVAKEIPLSSITLRKYEKPYQAKERQIVKRFCLSVGILEPGDSRDVIVDMLIVLLKNSSKKHLLSVEEIVKMTREERKSRKLGEKGCSEPNIRRQLLRVKNLGLVERVQSKYRIKEFMSMAELAEEVVRKRTEDILSRVILYSKAIDNKFSESGGKNA